MLPFAHKRDQTSSGISLMSRDINMYLTDMLDSCRRIGDSTAGMNQDMFMHEETTYWATVKNIEIIGEAAKYVPNEIRLPLPGIDWPRIIATRNVLTHRYFGIDDDILWDIVENHIPHLEHQLKLFLKAT